MYAGEGKPAVGEVGAATPPPAPTPGKYTVAHASEDAGKSPFDDSLDDPGEAV